MDGEVKSELPLGELGGLGARQIRGGKTGSREGRKGRELEESDIVLPPPSHSFVPIRGFVSLRVPFSNGHTPTNVTVVKICGDRVKYDAKQCVGENTYCLISFMRSPRTLRHSKTGITSLKPVSRWLGKKFFQRDALPADQQLTFGLE